MSQSNFSYKLVEYDDSKWHFEESPAAGAATDEFDVILEEFEGSPELARRLREFLKKYPDHIDAWHHLGRCQYAKGRKTAAYRSAKRAVEIGLEAVNAAYLQIGPEIHLPGDRIENRPFLRALHGLLIYETETARFYEAFHTACLLREFDPSDPFLRSFGFSCENTQDGQAGADSHTS